MNYDTQILRIKEKFALAKAKDTEFKTFGSSSHKYEITTSKTEIERIVHVFEKTYNIVFPECYKAYITQFAMGGAGPYYGLYPFGDGFDSMSTEPKKNLSDPCVLFSEEWSRENWDDKIDAYEEKYGEGDEAYDDLVNQLFSGTITLGTSGCTGYFGLILNGKNKGRVFAYSSELYHPNLMYEDTFLDWYEHWLDDIISGRALKGKETFGYRIPNEKPFDGLLEETDEEKIKQLLTNIDALESISEIEGKMLVKLYETHPTAQIGHESLATLANFHPNMVKPILQSIVKNYNHELYREAIDIINYRLKDDKNEWVKWIAPRLNHPTDEGLFRIIMYILTDTNYDFSDEVIPYCNHTKEEVRKIAYYSLGQIKTKGQNLVKALKQGLAEKDSSNLIYVLQAIDKEINDFSFLPYYSGILQKYSHKNHVMPNIMTHLEHLGKEAFSKDGIKEAIKEFINSNDDFYTLSGILFKLYDLNISDLLDYATQHQQIKIANYTKGLVFLQKMQELHPSDFPDWLVDHPLSTDYFDELQNRIVFLLENSGGAEFPYFKLNFFNLLRKGYFDKVLNKSQQQMLFDSE